MKLFLDDIRIPLDCIPYMHTRIGPLNSLYKEDWNIVRNYEQFVEVVKNNHTEITHISFDHDLADGHYEVDFKAWEDHSSEDLGLERTGYDAAKYLKEFYAEINKPLPIMFVHSMNPVGTKNIINLFK